jgi:hypothetical protein
MERFVFEKTTKEKVPKRKRVLYFPLIQGVCEFVRGLFWECFRKLSDAKLQEISEIVKNPAYYLFIKVGVIIEKYYSFYVVYLNININFASLKYEKIMLTDIATVYPVEILITISDKVRPIEGKLHIKWEPNLVKFVECYTIQFVTFSTKEAMEKITYLVEHHDTGYFSSIIIKNSYADHQ